jgi:hypothetical protein
VNKQKKVLIILLAVLGAIALYKFLTPVPRQRVKALTYTGDKHKNRLTKNIPSETSSFTDFLVRTDILNRPAFKNDKIKRDLFYLKGQIKNSDEMEGEKSLMVEQAPDESIPKHRAEIDLPQYSFFGSLTKDGIKTIFLSKENDIYLVKKGKRVDNDYLVCSIETDIMTLLLQSTNEEISVGLQEDTPLRVINIKKISEP